MNPAELTDLLKRLNTSYSSDDLAQQWPSTKALSVVNIFVFTGRSTITTAELTALLRRYWLPIPDDYVQQGVDFLVTKGVAKIQNGEVNWPRKANGQPLEARRINSDADLEFF